MPVSFFNRFNDLRRGGAIYPSPFFDIAQTYMPPTIKELFKWAKLYFYTHFAIRPTIVKLSAYPITDLIYTGDEELCSKWRYILDTVLNVKSHFINAGLDKHAMGNSVCSMFFPFQRRLKCQHCQSQERIEGEEDWWSFKDLEWKGVCVHCKNGTVFEVMDQYVQDVDRLNLIRWSIENIDVKYNEITGRSRYYYNIPNRIKRAILSNDKQTIAETPLRFIQAVKEDKAIELHPDNVFHMKEITLAEEDQGYGKPIILSSMRDAFYLQILRKANEAIALQYIVPLSILFPESNASFDPYRHMNLADWRAHIEEELMRWKDDPNYIPILPGPMGHKEIFGNAKALMVTPEIRAVTEQIVTGMGVPQEFVFGGMQWSGSHVSLRMIENQLLRHREQMTRMLNWIVDRISRFFKLDKVEIRFSDFKMADDIQLKQIMGNMVQSKTVSKQSYVQEFGLTLATEQKQVMKETEFENELMKKQMIGQAEAQGAGLQITTRYQTKAQLEQKKVMEEVQKDDVVGQLQATVSVQKDMAIQQAASQGKLQQQPGGEQPRPAQEQGGPRPQGQAFQDGLSADQHPGSYGDSKQAVIDPRAMARQFVVQLDGLEAGHGSRVLENMKAKMPTMYDLVMAQREIVRNQGVLSPIDAPMPHVKPPRREVQI